MLLKRPLLTRKMAAEYLNVSERTFDTLRSENAFYEYLVRGHPRWKEEDLDAYLESNKKVQEVAN